MIEALILKIPVIYIPGIDYNWGMPSIIDEKGCYSSSIPELKHLLKKILFDLSIIDNNKLYKSKRIGQRDD